MPNPITVAVAPGCTDSGGIVVDSCQSQSLEQPPFLDEVGRAREKRRLTQVELAKRVGVTRVTISCLEAKSVSPRWTSCNGWRRLSG